MLGIDMAINERSDQAEHCQRDHEKQEKQNEFVQSP
jgi:hypothetical protein